MQVITVEEDNHGQIGIASNYQNAIHFLVNENWLNELTEVYDSGFQDTKLLLDLLGEEWLATILNWTLEQFNEFFDGCFYLNEVSVYEVAQSTSKASAPRQRMSGAVFHYTTTLTNLSSEKCRKSCTKLFPEIWLKLLFDFFIKKCYYYYTRKGKKEPQKNF